MLKSAIKNQIFIIKLSKLWKCYYFTFFYLMEDEQVKNIFKTI